MKKTGNRYRVEGGRWCIDIRLRSARQLFDGRDPAPFRDRDLDDKAVEYLIEASKEIPRREDLGIVLHLQEGPDALLTRSVLLEAVRGHFTYLLAQNERIIREHVKRAQLFLAIGLSVLVAFLTLAEMTLRLPEGTLQQVLREGLIITGWVAMWRPLEALLYDWWPYVDRRRLFRRILAAELDVRVVETPAASLPV